MERHQPDDSYPAGEATPVEISDSTPIPVLPVQRYLGNSRTYTNQQQYNRSDTLNTHIQSYPIPQHHARPCSSCYSQPCMSHSSSQNHSIQPTFPPPPVPRLTSTALRSLEQRFAVPDDRPETEYCRRGSDSGLWHHSDDEDNDNDNAISPTSTSARTATPMRRVSADGYLSAAKRTAVSEYLRDRTWLPSSPSYSRSRSPPLPVGIAPTTNQDGITAAIGRRRSTRESISDIAKRAVRNASVSSSGGSRNHSHSHSRKGNDSGHRKSILSARPVRGRSDTCPQPYLLRADPQDFVSQCEYDHGCEHDLDRIQTNTVAAPSPGSVGEWQPPSPSGRSRKRSLTKTISSFAIFGSRKSVLKRSAATSEMLQSNSSSAVSCNKKAGVVVAGDLDGIASPLIGIPYEKSRIGPSPIHIPSVRALEGGSIDVHTTHQQPRESILPHHHISPSQIRTITTPTTPTYPSPSTPAPKQQPRHIYPTRLRRTHPPHLHPKKHISKPLNTQTRDALSCSNQGMYLFIGTLRGPTPHGLRSLHAAMERAIARYGEVEGVRKGGRKISKWLRHEDRGVIEWVGAYVKGRWGLELGCG